VLLAYFVFKVDDVNELNCVGVDRFWLKRWRALNEYIDPKTSITDEVLDDIVLYMITV
jgi:hypothetical protein